MTDLTAITALGGTAPQSLRFGALTLTENTGLALASVALRAGAAVPSPMGLALPGPGGWTPGSEINAFWTGPSQWMVEGPGRADRDFAALVASACPGCSVTEQTDGFVAFEITSDGGAGPVEALLSRLVNVDLAGFGPGRATRTGLEHMTVFVIRRVGDHAAVLGLRSSAGSLWHALTLAAERLADG